MIVRRLFTAGALAALSLLLAACGAAGRGGGGNGLTGSGAAMVRAGVTAFVAVDSDLGSDQWRQLDELAQKFPGRDDAVAKLERSLSKHGLDYRQDVKPALGPEVDVAVVSGGTESSTKAVALTKPPDPAKFKALVAKLNASDTSGDQAVYREVDGWYALSDSQAAITAVLKGDRTPLSEDATYKEASGKLAGDALVKAYVDGGSIGALLEQKGAQGATARSLGLDTLKYVAVSVSAESDGVRIHGASSGGNLGGGELASKLIDSVPGDAFAFLSFNGKGTAEQLGELESSPQVGAALKEVQAALGVPLDQVLALLQGEVVFYARPGGLIPELTLAVNESDVSGALDTLDKIAANLAAKAKAHVEEGTQGGHKVKTISFGQFAIHYGAVGDTVVITTGVTGVADFGASGDRLADSADFKEAKDAAGMPDSSSGVVYIDLKDALPLLESFAGLSGHGLSTDVTENLQPLRSFLAWSEGSGAERTFDAFLEIK